MENLSGTYKIMGGTALALRDLSRGVRDIHAWSLLAWDDVVARYRRTLLGPLWITLSHGIFVGALAIAFSVIFGQELASYFVYLAAGITIWLLISNTLMDGPHIFVRARGLLFSYDLPASIHVLRTVLSHIISFAHHMLIYVAALFLVANVVNINTLWAIPGFAVLVLAIIGWSTILAILGARYRDLMPAIAAATQMMFLLTPIFWERANLQQHDWFALVNPLYHLIEVVRRPLLGQAPEPLTWAVTIAIAVVLNCTAVALFAWKRRHLSYWL